MRRPIFALTIAFVALAAVAAQADDAAVAVGHNRLTPPAVTIAAGESVTFTNEQAMPGGHTVVADDGSFESPALDKDESWSHTFDEPGTHAYHIKQHPDAKGTITVE